jgi:hypothetical protein
MKRSVAFRTAFAALLFSTSAQAQLDREAPKFTPVIDGVITAAEMAGQLEVSMEWPFDNGFIAFEGAGTSRADLSAKWYVSWDDKTLNFSAVVADNTPDFRIDSGGVGNVPYNAQDLIQPCFNPFNNPDHPFPPDPGGGPAAIYDMVVDTADGFGPDIYRHGATLSEESHAAIKIEGKKTATGYILEAAVPWSIAMDDVAPKYAPKIGDEHGLSFILVSFNGQDGATPDIATLYTDFGGGANTIGDPTTWNKLMLAASRTKPGDFNSNGVLDAADINLLSAAARNGQNPLEYDLNADKKVNDDDRTVWVNDLKKTWLGDSNLDGLFNSTDLVLVFQAGQFEDGTVGNSNWEAGDWNGDAEFNSSDFVVAFQAGGYEQGPRGAVSAVPEPGTAWLALSGLLAPLFRRRPTRGNA